MARAWFSYRNVSPRFAATVLFLASSAAWAADEPAFGKRVQEFDMARINPMQDVKFESRNVQGIRAAKGLDGSTADLRTFQTGEFQTERSFLGIKNPWIGKKVFVTDKADNSLKVFLDGQTNTFSTKAVVTTAARETSRQAPAAAEEVPTRKANPRAGAQGSLDSLADPLKKNLSVEDVREILNKNR
ncbi:MAG: hypothetical protein Fur0032_06370 [Terrimicrobiaceae bacterium]